jgi:uncharacterized membrane protein YphA (DoxX/SURF4 family)
MKRWTIAKKQTEKRITLWMADHSILFLRIALGTIFFWFGFLKFFPALSSAENLAVNTIDRITFKQIPNDLSVHLLAIWECLIGIGLMFGYFMRLTLGLLFLQMLGTLLPLFIFPAQTFTHIPYAPSLEGQYIIKNLAIIAAAIVLAATIRGGKVVADPKIAEKAKDEELKKMEQLDY